LACSPDGDRVTKEIYGERAAWVPYLRPGFTLSKEIGALAREKPELECVVMGKHGLVTWGETSAECYANTLRLIGDAEAFIASRKPAFRAAVMPLGKEEADALLADVLPIVRGVTGGVLKVDRDQEVLEFVGAPEAADLAQVGAACPDHLVHTKRLPLFVPWQPQEGRDALAAALEAGLKDYERDYRDYFKAHADEGDRIFPPTPRILLVPGLGLITSGGDAAAAEVSRQLYRRAIAVMRGAQALGGFVSLAPAEAFAIEYWPLELYKLSLKPPPKGLAGKAAFVTGAASGIGKAIAERLAQEGAHVVIADINAAGAQETAGDLCDRHGFERAVALGCDVTSEAAVEEAFRQAVLAYGGLDIVVNNAGIASSAPIEETSLAMWEKNQAILSTGYFLVAREAFKLWRRQGSGGRLIVIGSKNSLVAGKNAAAYSAAKAAEIHLARCLAEEGGAAGIRVNSILPDAVLSGSGIWSSAWREERAATYGVAPEDLEEHYRQRTTLKVNVYPEDIAEAALFFASEASSKTTGGVLTVDGGVAAAYVR
ncbi:MAG: bifunctional rhamnulose-1-phosphate aldolase/short-chain dehydrogenase, partial [Deinococcota bacterium]|nr:bifunctional rhamnulose-1-phosphate aldolase/short-chain dehydrogenase [Deinococcota bacterium]